ncbi:MAG: hypothetical protein KDC92_07925 [Bacteroidetes bacterium]|nr:hypothetical protein [Bacteroidota bacterium]
MEVKSEIFEYTWLEQNILYCEFLRSEITLESARLALDQRMAIQEGKVVYMIVDASRVGKISKPARDLMGSPEGYAKLHASALIIKSSLGKMLVNFFYKFSSPPVPSRVFNTKEEAISWIKSLA